MEEVLKKIEEQNAKIDSIYASVEKTRKYFLWTFIITIVLVLLPLLILPLVLSQGVPGLVGSGLDL